MNEDDWLACRDPSPMIRFLVSTGISERKSRLLACACCRQIWPLLPDPRSRHAVEVAERFADGEATPLELARARAAALGAAGGGERQAAWAAYWAANTKARGPLWNAFAAAGSADARHATATAAYGHAAVWEERQTAGFRDQVALVHEVIGNPFRPPPLDPGWLTWGNGIVPALARGIYDDDSFEQMPILGDALEEAGCGDERILEHCRASGDHVRGCWVLDLLLDKA